MKIFSGILPALDRSVHLVTVALDILRPLEHVQGFYGLVYCITEGKADHRFSADRKILSRQE